MKPLKTTITAALAALLLASSAMATETPSKPHASHVTGQASCAFDEFLAAEGHTLNCHIKIVEPLALFWVRPIEAMIVKVDSLRSLGKTAFGVIEHRARNASGYQAECRIMDKNNEDIGIGVNVEELGGKKLFGAPRVNYSLEFVTGE